MNQNLYEFLAIYMVGCFAVGLPMAITSATFYRWEDNLDSSPWKLFLEPIRNILHPCSFIFLPDYERNRPRFNSRWCYGGPIHSIMDEGNPNTQEMVFYVTLSTIVWPLRLTLSLLTLVILVLGPIFK